jgi:hypothetical protein
MDRVAQLYLGVVPRLTEHPYERPRGDGDGDVFDECACDGDDVGGALDKVACECLLHRR